jgi:hypothetical protein
LPVLQQHSGTLELVSSHVHQVDGIAVGVAQGVRGQQVLPAEATDRSLALPLQVAWVPAVLTGALRAQAPPAASPSPSLFLTPPAQAPPVVLL